MKLWKVTSKDLVLSSVLFKMFKVGFQSEATGKEGRFDVLETRHWTNIIPVMKDGTFLMVRQFRFGTAKLSLEFPAGVVEYGEDPRLAAIRELKEETGSMSDRVEALGVCHPNPAFLNNTMYHFIAYETETKFAQELDHYEEIEIERLTENEVDEKILNGEISHSLSHSAWLHYKMLKNK